MKATIKIVRNLLTADYLEEYIKLLDQANNYTPIVDKMNNTW